MQRYTAMITFVLLVFLTVKKTQKHRHMLCKYENLKIQVCMYGQLNSLVINKRTIILTLKLVVIQNHFKLKMKSKTCEDHRMVIYVLVGWDIKDGNLKFSSNSAAWTDVKDKKTKSCNICWNLLIRSVRLGLQVHYWQY